MDHEIRFSGYPHIFMASYEILISEVYNQAQRYLKMLPMSNF